LWVLPHFLLQRPLQTKRARAEELWPCPAIHLSFERFQAIDLSFRLAGSDKLTGFQAALSDGGVGSNIHAK